MVQTTLCYLERNDEYLMLHRVKKHHDENAGKWIGVGGHIKKDESPKGCVRRETLEETGLVLGACHFRGIVDFYSDVWENERMFLYTSDDFSGNEKECDEGILKWIPKKAIMSLNLWEGDRIFLKYLQEDLSFFHLELHYEGDHLMSWKLYPRIVLASQSPRRVQLLEQIGIYPEVHPSFIEERTMKTVPEDIVKDLSRQKAEGVVRELILGHNRFDHRDCYVIAADTVVSLDRKVLGKPVSHEKAAEMIRAIQGRTHQVYTGVTICRLTLPENKNSDETYRLDRTTTFAEKTDVHVASMTEEEIRDYAMSDEPMDKAGAYGIQGSFAAFVTGIDGDYNTVVGLPVRKVYETLKEMKN